MSHKLDLIPYYINRHRKLQSKWVSISRGDIILLAGFDLKDRKDCVVTYRFDDNDSYSELGDVYINVSIGLEIIVKKIRNQ